MVRKPSNKMSLIWKHGYEAPPKVPRGHPSWLCNICGQRYSLKSTKHARDHLRETHGIEEEGGQSKLTTLHSSRQISEERLWEILVDWVVDRRHPFNEVEAESFRALVEYLNPMAVSK